MNGDKMSVRRKQLRRFQFSLASLLIGVTFLCFAFAYPLFSIGLGALLTGVFLVLVAFIAFVQIPVDLASRWLTRRSASPNHEASNEPETRRPTGALPQSPAAPGRLDSAPDGP